MRGIRKAFPGVQALSGVDLTLSSGEALALLGENGAGKSTLIKVLSGAHSPDEGTIFIDGQSISIANPVDAERHGIAVIYQEFNLVPTLPATDNIFLGSERTRHGFIQRSKQVVEVTALFDRIGLEIDPNMPVNRLTVAQQQGVEIAKALSRDARILVMDEPSAALSHKEVDRLYGIVDELKRQAMGIIYISHRLDEVDHIADRISVLRDGAHVGTRMRGEVTRQELIELMVGRKLENEFPEREITLGEPRLQVSGLHKTGVAEDIDFQIHRGEVLGLTGLVGAGRTEMVRLLFGADFKERGTVSLDGKALRIRSPREAIAAGICLLTEDRKSQGLILGQSVRENFGLPNLRAFTKGCWINHREETRVFQGYIDKLGIKVPTTEQAAGNLSGGNQQKVVLAKWLYRNAEVIIFDEPTRGIDVGAKYEIYQLINQLAKDGKAILVISSELPEVLGMSDRIFVMRDGKIAGIVEDGRAATQEALLKLAMGQN